MNESQRKKYVLRWRCFVDFSCGDAVFVSFFCGVAMFRTPDVPLPTDYTSNGRCSPSPPHPYSRASTHFTQDLQISYAICAQRGMHIIRKLNTSPSKQDIRFLCYPYIIQFRKKIALKYNQILIILLTCWSHTVNEGKFCRLIWVSRLYSLLSPWKWSPAAVTVTHQATETKRTKNKTFEVILPCHHRCKPSPNTCNNEAKLCNNLNLAVHLSFKTCAAKLT